MRDYLLTSKQNGLIERRRTILIFTRRNSTSFMVGDDVEVIILASGNNFVKVGVNAPPDVAVHRTEIYEKLRREGGVHSFAGKNKASEKRYCDCNGDLSPGAVCKWIVTGAESICGYKGDEYCDHME